ncbi:MAG TPA: right-handed parallel beta-helix repeat-containing protein [candidate division Zixibacteria bacterium]|nr:right-handed parallel beta-helix repeat-containing protein [candidate division Zixibacteria bacterium]
MKKTVSGIILAFLILSVLLLSFNVHPVRAEGTIHIRADGSIDPPSAPVESVDNVSYVFTDNINGSIVVERGSIIIDGAGHTLEGQGIYGEGTGTMDLEGEGNVTVQNTKIENFVVGILVNSSYGDTIRNDVIQDGGYSGVLVYSRDSTIAMNNFTNDDQGIVVLSSSENTVIGNWIDGNFDAGIVLGRASNNTLQDNKITNSFKIGIDVGFSSTNNVINKNDITGNGVGVQLSYSSNNNTILDNNVTINNVAGISVGYRMPEDASSYAGVSGNIVSGNNISQNACGLEFLFSTGNRVFHNNFEANTIQAKAEESPSNLLDYAYPFGGNYWSDYNGSDMFSGTHQNITGSDGIGDTPYAVDSNHTDHFPLMAPFETFNVTWSNSSHSVSIVSNSSIDDFTLSSPNWPTLSFTVAGADGTTGFCRVAIPEALINSGTWDDMWAVTVNGTLIKDRTVVSDAFYTYIYFTYHQSIETVQITIPEFHLLLIPFLFMAATLAATVARWKARAKNLIGDIIKQLKGEI